jgi:hypothetical protein
MPLPWPEIRDKAIAFSREWQDAESERAEAQTFWNEFFAVFGVPRRRVASFEEPVKKLGEKRGRIDAFWKGQLVVEHKSRGQDLDRAFVQALDYFPGIPDRDLPKFVLVSDFARFRLYDLDSGAHSEFALKDLHKHIKRFGFIAGYAPQEIKPQDPVNIKAAERMGRLHDLLKASGYAGHDLEVLLVRLVFCMFADDTGIFTKQSFRDWLEARTAEDGADLGQNLALLFQVLNTPEDKRQKNLDEQLAAFAYINGKLFEETLKVASFDRRMRATLLDCCALNWGAVSPAVFGALFQSIMDEKARRNLGAHYTSEENILKLIKPLFLDDLWAEFNKVKKNKNRLFEFHKKLRSLVFLDPACGCGNFLVITYRELRLLELEVLRAVHSGPGSRFLNIHQELTLDVDQFYGIEIEDFPAQIAQVALWLIDHQMNLKVSEEFGMYFARIPLTSTPHIMKGNALTLDWSDVVPSERLSYILGNPPFVGAKFMDSGQRANAQAIFAGIDGGGLLDFVAAWYVKAARYISNAGERSAESSLRHIKVAFVSTNSISQGEQVGVLWGELLRLGMKIHFAHRTFRWNNEAKGVAAVHCVIVGFAAYETDKKVIFDYDSINGEPHAIRANRINPYLVDAPDVLLHNRETPICHVPLIGIGNKPVDGGYYLFSPEEKKRFLREEPHAEPLFKRWIGSKELLNGVERWCLFVSDVPPDRLRRLPEVMKIIDSVRRYRLGEIPNKTGSREAKDKPESSKKLAQTPTAFHVTNVVKTNALVIPRHSAQDRAYIPMGYFDSSYLIGDACLMGVGATSYHFGVLSSAMHAAWVRYTCGRIKSDFRYSAGIVYNNFPWPLDVSTMHRKSVEIAGQAVLDTRTEFPKSSLADLYDPLSMPPTLTKAHRALDRAVDDAYGNRNFSTDAERVAFLFELYQRYSGLFHGDMKPKRKAKPANWRRKL